MPDVPPDVAIRATIRPGSVYYFPEETFESPEPHYFIVINTNPEDDTALLLVCASSQIEKVKKRRSGTCPAETLVTITPDQYPGFNVDSIMDCNQLYEKTIGQLVDKLSRNDLKIKEEMDEAQIRRLRKAVRSSPLIEGRIKALLQD